jgi:anti-anti-sigma factor
MRIEAKSKDSGAILHLSGKVIGDSVTQLKRTIDERISSGANWIIIDLAEVPLMDSSALGTIIAAFLRLQEKNGKLALLNAQKNILDVLAITKLDSLFEVYHDMQTALESIGSQPHRL